VRIPLGGMYVDGYSCIDVFRGRGRDRRTGMSVFASASNVIDTAVTGSVGSRRCIRG